MLKVLWSDQSIDQDIDFLRVCRSRSFEVYCSTTTWWIEFIFGMVFTDAVNSRYTLNFLWSDQSIDQDIDFLRVRRSRFFEVNCSTTAQRIKLIFGMMFMDAVSSRSMLKFLWSDQSIDQDIDFSACVAVTLFRWSMLIRFVQNKWSVHFFEVCHLFVPAIFRSRKDIGLNLS